MHCTGSYKGSQRALSLSLLLKKSGVMCGHWHGWRSLEFQLLPIPSTLPNPPSNHLQLPWTRQGYQKDRPQTLQTAKSFCSADSTHTQKETKNKSVNSKPTQNRNGKKTTEEAWKSVFTSYALLICWKFKLQCSPSHTSGWYWRASRRYAFLISCLLASGLTPRVA